MVLSSRVGFHLREIQGTETKVFKKFEAQALMQEAGKLPLRRASEMIAEAKQSWAIFKRVVGLGY